MNIKITKAEIDRGGESFTLQAVDKKGQIYRLRGCRLNHFCFIVEAGSGGAPSYPHASLHIGDVEIVEHDDD